MAVLDATPELLSPTEIDRAFRDPFALSSRTRGVSWAVLLALLVAFPLVFTNPAVTSVAVFTMFYLLAAIAWNIFSGYSGYISIGHAVYYGFGQYTVALLILHLRIQTGVSELMLIPVSGVVAAAVAVPVGLLVLRVRRHTFIVLTIAVMFIFQLLAFNFPSITGGSTGMNVTPPTWSGNNYNLPFYYVALGTAIIALLVSWGVRRSKFGLGLLAIRDDEDRAKGLGIKVTRTKLLALVISAFFVGIAGALYAIFIGQVFPQFAFTPFYDLYLAIFTFVGGLGTLAGPVFGALLLGPLQQYFEIQFGATTLYLIIYGVLFIVILLLLPRGVVPSVADRYHALLAARWRKLEARRSLNGSAPGNGSAPDDAVARGGGRGRGSGGGQDSGAGPVGGGPVGGGSVPAQPSVREGA
jgi:branched-chain amino acid transport system permease protein